MMLESVGEFVPTSYLECGVHTNTTAVATLEYSVLHLLSKHLET